jgi:RHS repeat-associated protein
MTNVLRTALVAVLLTATALEAGDLGDRTFTPLAGGSPGRAGVGSRGNFTASLPIVLPEPRGGLPMPFTVAWTGSASVGAGGVGWDIPIASVVRQSNLSRRKPVHQLELPIVPPFTADRVFLDTGGGPTLMVRTATANVFQPFGGGYFELTFDGGAFNGRDSAGRHWRFERLPALLDQDVFALVRITDALGTNRIEFRYDVYDRFSVDPVLPPFLPNRVSMRELLLAEVTHSHDSTGSCPKYRVRLGYRPWLDLKAPAPYPGLIGLDFAEGRPRAHTRILDTVRLESNADTACSAPGRRTERTWRIHYSPDAVTGLPRLSKVDWFGTGDPATSYATSLPVAAYRYANPLAGGELKYTMAEDMQLPTPPPDSGAGFSSSLGTGTLNGLVRDFQDINGDGRADFVSLNAAGSHPVVAINRPSSLGTDFSLLDPPADFSNDPGAPYNLGAPDLSLNLPVVASIENVRQQVIDFNGDGRPDILTSTGGKNPQGRRDPNYWLLLVNTPGGSGLPADVAWLERHVEITPLRAAIQAAHVLSLVSSNDQAAKDLPLMRTHQVGAFANNILLESGILTQWKLIDVNGDGFPDFVFDSKGVEAREEEICDAAGNCQAGIRQDHGRGNSLMVIYHTGPLMAGHGGETQNVWNGPPVQLRADGACGVERLTSFTAGRRVLQCAFMEANGDGLVDYVVQDGNGFRAIRSPGLAQVHDVLLPENEFPTDYSLQEKKRSIALPGPVGQLHDPRTSKCSSGSGRTTYDVEQLTALRDLTGDGVPDYVHFGFRGALPDGTVLTHPALTAADRRGPQGFWFMAGTGVGFAAPRAIRSPSQIPFAIQVSRQRCDGKFSSTMATLLDVDGDGRAEIVRAQPVARARIAKLVDGNGNVGAHDAGQLTEVDNRYGGVLRVTYGSAKSAWLTQHSVPFPQIVVTRVEQRAERGLGRPLAPVLYAYGAGEMVYQPLLGRWVFNGFRRRVELVGEPQAGGVKGTATISSALSSTELPANDNRRFMLAGRLRDTHLLAGNLPGDPRELLADSTERPAVSNQHFTWRTQALPGSVPLLVPLHEECYATPPADTPGIMGDLVLCRRAATAFVGEVATWEGNAPWPSPSSIASRYAVTDVDGFGRPLRVVIDPDRARADDDHCLRFAWPATVAGAPLFLDAPHSVMAHVCGNTSHVLSAVRHIYDGLPEGSVRHGRPSGRVLQRHDVSTGALLEQINSGTVDRDPFGNVVRHHRTRPDGAFATTTFAHDAFGLEVVRTETAASGVAAPLVAQSVRDTNNLLPLTVTDVHGTALHNTFDRFGRLTRRSASRPGDATRIVLSDSEFVGFEEGSAGRAVRHRIYHRFTPEADAPAADPATVGRYTELIDELGRPMHGIMSLGSDYANQALIVEATTYDLLGRPAFVADPFPAGIFGPRYGTTFTYHADGRSHCAIEGTGVQSQATTDETADRYPTCRSYGYEANQLVVRTQGPNELAAGRPQSGAFDEERSGADGNVLARSRVQNGLPLELMHYTYDRLGALASLRRFANPQAQIGTAQWSYTNDSLGNVLKATEPQDLVRTYTYDAWGNTTAVAWRDSTGIFPLDRGLSFRYDGLSRLLRSEETLFGQALPESIREYFYDVTSGRPQHLDTQFLLGRLAWTRTPGREVFLGYDGLGRLGTISRSDVGAGPDDWYAERRILGPSGELETGEILFPDTGHTPERSSYTYDSARRLRTVAFTDETGTTELWRALQTDIFGRPVLSRLGNGSTELFTYRPDGRREVLSRRLDTGSGSRTTTFDRYDGAMLLGGIAELSTIGGLSATATSYQYDARNALARATVQGMLGALSDFSYAYDGLGNLRSITDHAGDQSLLIESQKFDPDRVCRVLKPPMGGGDPPPGQCTYRYDSLGNVRSVQDTGAFFTHDGSGRLVRGSQDGATVETEYDSFGAPIGLRSQRAGLDRRERFFGGSGTRVDFFDEQGNPLTVGSPGLTYQNFTDRVVGSPDGTVATVRRSNTGHRLVLFPLGDYQGTREVVGGNNAVTQTIAYDPLGAVRADSLAPSSLAWWPWQWNGGHVLDGMGMVLLDQRALDPRTGRFLQRDPVVADGSASAAHPYSFAWNNPVKFIDPSGAQPPADGDDGGAVGGQGSFWPTYQPGDKIDPYIERSYSCDEGRDCMKIIEQTYGTLTAFEQELRKEWHSGPVRAYRWARRYYLVLDRLSGGGLLGYAMFDNNVTVYDRNGKGTVVGGNERPLEPSMFSPVDLIGLGLGSIVRSGVRRGVAAMERYVADDAVEGGVNFFRGTPYLRGSRTDATWLSGSLGRTSWKGTITMNPYLTPGSRLFANHLRHERVHRWLTPLGNSGLAITRQAARKFFYKNSHLLRYTEEVAAQTFKTGSLRVGMRYPFTRPDVYGISGLRLGVEAGAYVGGVVYGGYQLSGFLDGGLDR